MIIKKDKMTYSIRSYVLSRDKKYSTLLDKYLQNIDLNRIRSFM